MLGATACPVPRRWRDPMDRKPAESSPWRPDRLPLTGGTRRPSSRQPGRPAPAHPARGVTAGGGRPDALSAAPVLVGGLVAEGVDDASRDAVLVAHGLVLSGPGRIPPSSRHLARRARRRARPVADAGPARARAAAVARDAGRHVGGQSAGERRDGGRLGHGAHVSPVRRLWTSGRVGAAATGYSPAETPGWTRSPCTSRAAAGRCDDAAVDDGGPVAAPEDDELASGGTSDAAAACLDRLLGR